MRIPTNILAIHSIRRLGIVSRTKSRNAERLSSGLQINSAADDAAGLAISEKMRAQIRGLDMALRNAQDGISLIQTADGALSEIHEMLQRQREMAVQAANDIYANADRAKLDEEFQQLIAEIDALVKRAQFNNKTLLDGSFSKSAGSSPATMSAPVAAPYAATEVAPYAAAPATFDYTININTIGTTSNADYEFDTATGELLIKSNKTFKIEGSSTQTTNRISVQGDFTANIVLSNVNISTSTGAALDILYATVNLWLEGSNVLRASGIDYPGILNSGTLVIDGTGSVSAYGGVGGAGIGGSGDEGSQSNSTITINGGTVAAYGGVDGAGIGGGEGGDGGTITINGGAVTANGGTNGAGIGGGLDGRSGTIVINGGTIAAYGGIGGAGIGSGKNGLDDYDEDEITISGGKITAIGDGGSAGIGGGGGCDGGNVTISGGDITAAGSGGGAGIGGSVGHNDTGATKFTDKNLINALFGSIANEIQDVSGTAIYRTQITGATLGADTTVAYTIDGMPDSAKTYGSSLFLYLPASDNGKELKMTVGGINYVGTITAGGTVVLTPVTGPDTDPPVLSSGSSTRAADDKATVNFSISEAGQYYYVVQKKGDSVPNAADLLATAPKNCGAGSQTISLTGLDPDEYEIYILGKDTAGNESAVLKIGISAYNPAVPSSPTAHRGGLNLQIGANTGQETTVYIESMSTSSLGFTNASIGTLQGADAAISATNNAIEIVSTQRAALGAMQNRLVYTIESLGIASESTSAAESRIRDADMAKEMLELTQYNVLQHAATAMLAHANQSPQIVLELLETS